MVLSNETVLREQYANNRGPGRRAKGGKVPFKLKHVLLLDVQWKLQICLLFNTKITVIYSLHDPRSLSLTFQK